MDKKKYKEEIQDINSGIKCSMSNEIRRRLAEVKSDVDAAELISHLEQCPHCARRAHEVGALAILEDDLRWADHESQNEPMVDINVPLENLSRLLPAYEFLTEIGRGGMGIVYKVRHRKLDRLMALKVLPRLLAVVRTDAIDRFRREAILAAQLDHSNIVSVNDFDDVDGIFYYTMPFVEGRSLRSLLCEVEGTGAAELLIEPYARGTNSSGVDRTTAFSGRSIFSRSGNHRRRDNWYFQCIAEWIAEIADAIQYAHENGVIHRDIKPANLLLADDGRLMILDFGLAASSVGKGLTDSKSLLGTVRYMSPEQLDEEIGPVDAKSDIYALGATMYELLTLRPMFPGDDDQNVINSIRTRDPVRPHKISPRIPRELETICIKAVDKSPMLRYQSAREMGDDLRRWLLGLPIQARRPSLMVRSFKLVNRYPGLTAMSILLACVVILGGASFAKYRLEKNRTAVIQAIADKQSALLLGIEATGLIQQHQFETAMEKIVAAISLDPNSERLRLTRARILGCTGRESEAVRELKSMEQRNRNNWKVHYLLAMHYSAKANRNRMESGQVHPAAEYLMDQAEFHRVEVSRLIPDSAKPLILEASLQNDAETALKILDHASALEGGRLEVMMARFQLHYLNGNYEEALRNADGVIALQPAWHAGHEARARSLFSLGKYKLAEQTLTYLIRLDPNIDENWVNRGVSRIELMQFDDAIADLNEAIRLQPENANSYVARARAQTALGNLDQAMADCDRAVEIDPSDKNAYSQRCVLHRRLNQMKRLVADATKIIEIAPQDILGYQNRSVGLHELGQFDREIADLSMYIQLKSDDPVAYRSRARAFSSIGKRERALADLTRAIELRPGQYDHYRRANLLISMGKINAALPDLNRAIELNGDSGALLLKRGMVYEATGANELALADYDKLSQSSGRLAEYAQLAKYILARISNAEEAESFLPQSTDFPFKSWTNHLFELFRGIASDEDIFTAAATDEERCEAFYYVGMKAFFDHRFADAKSAFEDCIRMHCDACPETHFARLRLELLTQN